VLGRTIRDRWGDTILATAIGAPASNGVEAVRRFGARGVRQEAAEGFPLLFGSALPALRAALDRTGDREAALVQTLFVLIARLDDTNLLHRGGVEGLAFARRQTAAFLDAGGVHTADWRVRAVAVHRAFVARRLSPGGAADMLAACLFIHSLTGGGA
jgi:triphosphoribosyl-dephospho-CoA synthase